MKRCVAALLAAVIALGSTACVEPKKDSGSYDAAMAALEKGDYETAVSKFDEAAKVDKREAESFRGQGIVFYEQGNYESAVAMFEKSLEALKYENEDFKQDVLLYEADSYVKSRQSEKALEIYKGLEEKDETGMVFALEGKIYIGQKNTEEAKICFEASLEKDKSFDAYLMMYEAFKDASLEGDGVVYLEEAKKLTPKSADDHAKMGRVCEYLEEYDEAAANLNKAIEQGSSQAINMLGNIYLQQNDVSGAKALFMSALENGTDTAMAYNGLVMCSIAEGNYDSAVTFLEMGLACADENAKKSLMFNEIVIYEKKLDFNTAKEKAAVYMGLYPEDDAMRREYKFLTR